MIRSVNKLPGNAIAKEKNWQNCYKTNEEFIILNKTKKNEIENERWNERKKKKKNKEKIR